MRVYCKCLNVALVIYTSESKARPWSTIASENEELPASIDHESFQCDVFLLTAKVTNDVTVRPDDIVKRRKRLQMGSDEAMLIHAYFPRLVLTRQRGPWRIRECFICRTAFMAFETTGLNAIFPTNLLGMSSDDGLQAVESSVCALQWMLSRDAIAPCSGRLSEDVLTSHRARQHLESMTHVWRVAQDRAREEVDARVEELRRQEFAKYEELVRTAAEVQNQVSNTFYSLLTQLDSDPSLSVEDLESGKSTKSVNEHRQERSQPGAGESFSAAGDAPLRSWLHFSSESTTAAPVPTVDDVEVATEALDLDERTLFDDFGEPDISGLGDDPLGRTGNADQDDSEDEAEGVAILSTSAISSSIKASVGMRANFAGMDDRLPDSTAFNAMTDAERTYAIEKASYQMQDNRLHELYGDMEPPFLQDLRRQAERTRLNPTAVPEETSNPPRS